MKQAVRKPRFRPQSQGRKILQAGGILSGTFEAPQVGQQARGIQRGTVETPRFGKAAKGNQKENEAEGILSGTYEAPSTLHSVAESGGPCIIDNYAHL